MKKFQFFGDSDDLFCEENNGLEICDSSSGLPLSYRLVDDEGCGVIITGLYMDNGCWSIGVAINDETLELSDEWYFESDFNNSYKNSLVVTTPDDVTITEIK